MRVQTDILSHIYFVVLIKILLVMLEFVFYNVTFHASTKQRVKDVTPPPPPPTHTHTIRGFTTRDIFNMCRFQTTTISCGTDVIPPGLSRKEGNVLFNDALNTFYLRLYGVRHMVKDHSYSERGNPLPPHGLLFSISSKGSFMCIISQTW